MIWELSFVTDFQSGRMLMKSEVPNYDEKPEKPDSLNRNAEKAPDLLGKTFILYKAESISVITRGLFGTCWVAAFQRCTYQWRRSFKLARKEAAYHDSIIAMIHSVAEHNKQLCFLHVWGLGSLQLQLCTAGAFFLNLLLKVEVGYEDVPVFSFLALPFLAACHTENGAAVSFT